MANKNKPKKYRTIPHGKGKGLRVSEAPDDLIIWGVMKSESSKLLDMYYAEFKRRNLKIEK